MKVIDRRFFLTAVVTSPLIMGMAERKVFRSVSDGCWSCPLTWEENNVPRLTDTVIVNHRIEIDHEMLSALCHGLISFVGPGLLFWSRKK